MECQRVFLPKHPFSAGELSAVVWRRPLIPGSPGSHLEAPTPTLTGEYLGVLGVKSEESGFGMGGGFRGEDAIKLASQSGHFLQVKGSLTPGSWQP